MHLERRVRLVLLVLLTIGFVALLGIHPQSAFSAETCGHTAPERSLAGDDDESGIGGTGFRDAEPDRNRSAGDDSESGIGGTGIFGTVTGVDRLCVNGLEISVSNQVLAQTSNGGVPDGTLATGMVVWIRATRSEDGLVADEIQIVPGVVGEITAASINGRDLVISQQTVVLPTEAYRGPGVDENSPVVGQWRVVYGLRDENERLIASRIDVGQEGVTRADAGFLTAWLDEIRPLHALSIEGYIDGSPERPRLAGLNVDFPASHPGTAREAIRPGLHITAQGRLSSDGVFHIERSASHARPPQDPTIDRPAPTSPSIAPGESKGSERPTDPQNEQSPSTSTDKPRHAEIERRAHRPPLPPAPPRIDRPRIRPTFDRPTRREVVRPR